MRNSNILAACTGLMIAVGTTFHGNAQSADWLVYEVAPTSGPASTVGTRLNKSTKMWVEEVNARGGINGKKIRLVTCNDEARPDKAVACVRDAIREGAVLILGHSLTGSLRAMQQALADGPVMIIASPNVVPPANSFAFQTSPSDEGITEAIASYLSANKLNKIGMVAATDASGEVGVASARKVFDEHKIELKLARVDLKATDATSQIAAVAGPDIKVVYSNYSGGGAATVVKSFTNLGLQQPLIVSYANLSQSFIDVVKGFLPPRLLGTSVRALVPASISDPAQRERAVAFMAAYRKLYNEPSDMINILGKFNVDVAEAILKNVPTPTDPKAVKAYLENTTIDSLHQIKFSPTSHVGIGANDVIIVEFKDGEWIVAGPVR